VFLEELRLEKQSDFQVAYIEGRDVKLSSLMNSFQQSFFLLSKSYI
jgi:hypothetical protein